MALITAQRFKNLKARVKAECQRRSYTGSVASYGGSSYDYTTAPASGKKIAKEHYEKLAVPLHAINSTKFPTTSGTRIIKASDLTAMETFLTSAEGRSKTSTATDCSASCTGLCSGCTGTCTGGCTGCSGSCTGSCTSCTGSCTGSCSGGCGDACTSCTGTCLGNCTGTCSTGCWSTCKGTCSGGCSGTCTIAGAGTQ